MSRIIFQLFISQCDKSENRKLSILIKYILNSSAQSMQIKAFLSAAVRTGQFKIWLSLTVGVKIVQIFYTNDKETIIFQRIFMIEYFIFELGCSNSKKSVKMRRKQQAYTNVVKSTWNKALSRCRNQGYGGKAVLEHASWRHRKWFSLFAAVLQPRRTRS